MQGAKKDEPPKQKLPRQRFVHIESTLTREQLKRMAAEGPPPKERPEGLPLKDLHVAENVFQWRRPGLVEEQQILADLTQSLQGKPLRPVEPILVTAVGTRFFVVDGHHRLDAYHTVKWKGLVPVEYFQGSLKDAQTEASARNRDNKLHRSREEKSEAAWRMMVDMKQDTEWLRTWQQIMVATGVRKTTLKRMAKVLREVNEKDWVLPWSRAWRAWQSKDELQDNERRDWKDEKARELAEYLAKGPNLMRDPEITAMALGKVSKLLPGALVCEWPDEVAESILAAVREIAPEKVEVVEDALRRIERPGNRNQAPIDPDSEDTADTTVTPSGLWSSL